MVIIAFMEINFEKMNNLAYTVVTSTMKKIIALLILSLFIIEGCGPKPAYKTRKGKKRLKHYNDILYDQKWKSNKRH